MLEPSGQEWSDSVPNGLKKLSILFDVGIVFTPAWRQQQFKWRQALTCGTTGTFACTTAQGG
jgi:hypothetical protein